jgi:integrase
MARYAGIRPASGGIEIRYQVRGRSFSHFIATAPTDAALQDAARVRRKLIEQAKLGLPDPVTDTITFESACQSFLRDIQRTREPSTALTYRKRLVAHWSELAHLDLRAITLAVLRGVDRDREWKSQKTRRDAHSVLAGVMQWGVSEGYLETNPARALRAGSWQRPEIDPFTSEELTAILRELRGQPKVLYSLMAETGIRTGEACALQWGDVEDDALLVKATLWAGKRKTTKTHQSRRVLLTREAKRILKEHTATRFAGSWVFVTSKNNPYAEEHLTEAFVSACERAGVRYRRPYTLRHTYASRALSAGVEPSWLASQLGDRIETVLRHYARWIGGERDKNELAKLEKLGGSWE